MAKVKLCVICGYDHSRRNVDYCYECGRKREIEAWTQLNKKEGPIYEKWKARWEAATGLKMKGGK